MSNPADDSPRPTPTASDGLPAALQAALAATYAATYAYGLLGAQLPPEQRQRARDDLDAQRLLRQELRSTLAQLDQQPQTPQALYTPPFAITDAASARKLAGQVETGLIRSWAVVAGASDTAGRDKAITHARACAKRAVSWGAQPQAFPGATN